MSGQIPHVAKPSHARRLILEGFIPRPRGSATATAPILSWPAKDPQDILDYEFDIAPALVGDSGDGIANVSVTVSPANPGDLTVTSTAADGSTIVLWLSAGQTGTTYVVTLLVTMMSGRTLQRSILLPVMSLSNITPPATAFMTDTGVAVTDQAGNPILSS